MFIPPAGPALSPLYPPQFPGFQQLSAGVCPSALPGHLVDAAFLKIPSAFLCSHALVLSDEA